MPLTSEYATLKRLGRSKELRRLQRRFIEQLLARSRMPKGQGQTNRFDLTMTLSVERLDRHGNNLPHRFDRTPLERDSRRFSWLSWVWFC